MVELRALPGTRLPAWPMLPDWYEGSSTALQEETEDEIAQRLQPYRTEGPLAAPGPVLRRKAHLDFMSQWMRPLSSEYVAFDQNRSWLIFWVAQTYDLLGSPWGTARQARQDGTAKDVRTRAVDTLLSFQNPVTGGFAGGPGQNAHLMTSYAAVMALATVGGPADGTSTATPAWDLIDREKMYTWMMSLKQPNGSFMVTEGGEIDVRCTYCVLCISLALGICTPELIEGMDRFIVSCQTYDGGVAEASYSTFNSHEPAFPLGEAHAGYAHCAIASMAVLMRLKKAGTDAGHSPRASSSMECSVLDLAAFYRWAIHLQGTPIEGGAFRGRTNKLVDGCYGYFAGAGLFSCLEAAMMLDDSSHHQTAPPVPHHQEPSADAPPRSSASDTSWVTETHEDSWLFDRASLQEYILICAQSDPPRGGLKDKPSKRPDAYHTCYNLSALSLCQHRILISDAAYSAIKRQYKSASLDSAAPLADTTKRHLQQSEAWRAHCYAASLAWEIDDEQRFIVGGEQNMVVPTHPIFNVAFIRIKQMMDHFYGQV